MRVWKHIEYVWDATIGEYVIDKGASRWEEYDGPVAECKKNSSAPGPDPRIGQAALENVKLGKQLLQFTREQTAIGNQRQEKLDKMTEEVTGAQLASMRSADERATQMWERYQEKFLPVEDRVIKDANEFDSPEKQAAAAAAAKADIQTAAGEARASRTRNMAAMGIDPRSGRYAGVERAADTQVALASAGAQNTARERVKAQGMALREGVANLGRGATSTAAQQASLSLTSGNSASGNAMGAEGNWRANTGIMAQGFQGAMGANQTAAGMFQGMDSTRMAGAQLKESSRQANMNFVGDLIGTGAGAAIGLMSLSSKEAKENKKPVKGALPALKGLNVEEWDYKEGMGDGGHHIGPYAEDFKQQTGMGDGKTINMIDAMGITMKAVQELDEKVDKLATGNKTRGRKAKTEKETS